MKRFDFKFSVFFLNQEIFLMQFGNKYFNQTINMFFMCSFSCFTSVLNLIYIR